MSEKYIIDELIDRLEEPSSWQYRIVGDSADITRGSFAPLDAAAELEKCREYLKPHEMPVDRIRRDFSEMQTLLKLYADVKKENEWLGEMVETAYREGWLDGTLTDEAVKTDIDGYEYQESWQISETKAMLGK